MAKIDRQSSFLYHINHVYFGNDYPGNEHLLENQSNIQNSNPSSHTTFDMKIYPVMIRGYNSTFAYSASRFELDNAGSSSTKAYTGLYLKYSLQPNSLRVESKQSGLFRNVGFIIGCFGSIYSLLRKSFFHTSFLEHIVSVFYKRKSDNKRDSNVCSIRSFHDLILQTTNPILHLCFLKASHPKMLVMGLIKLRWSINRVVNITILYYKKDIFPKV